MELASIPERRRKLALRVIAGLAISFLPGGALASNWVPVGNHGHGTILLDSDSVEQHGTNVTAWIELKQAHSDDNVVAYEVDHWSIDCKNMTVASLSTVQYDRNGNRTAGDGVSAYYPERTAIAPYTVGFEVYRLVCR